MTEEGGGLVRGLHEQRNMTLCARALVVLLSMTAAGGCATGRQAARPAPRRIADSAPERLTGLREANPEQKAAATEARFGAEEDKKRREDARAARADQQTRVDVVEKKKKPVTK
jgi:hypothetical protein